MQPGQFNPKGEDWIGRKFAEMEREIRELKAANPFSAMGVEPKPDGLIVNGYETVNGPLEVNGAMEVNGASVFNGALSILGALFLQPGIIENDALANPLTTGSAGFTASNQSFNTTPTQYGTQIIAVPEGFTNAVVINGVSAGATNSGAGGDYIYVASGINGVGGGEMPSYANAGFYASGSAFGIRTLAGLAAGSTISVSAQVRTSSGTWAPSSANIANVNALAIFYR